MENNSTKSGGIGFCELLIILFIALKLTNVITWSWWWVLAPMWTPFAIVLLFIIFGAIFVAFKRLYFWLSCSKGSRKSKYEFG